MADRQFPLTLQAVQNHARSAWEIVDAITAECDLSGDRFERGELQELARFLLVNDVDYSTESIRKTARVARFMAECSEPQRDKFRHRSSVYALVEVAQAGFTPDAVERLIDQSPRRRLTQANARHAARAVQRGVDTAINKNDPENWDQDQWDDFEKRVERAILFLGEAMALRREGLWQPDTYTNLMLKLGVSGIARELGYTTSVDWDAGLAQLTGEEPPQ